ncbi:dynein axonemal heavy chain 9 [Sarcophilus harrisii]
MQGKVAAVSSETKDGNGEEGPDPKFQLLGKFVIPCLRPAAGAWKRCAGTAESRLLLQDFLAGNNPQEPMLVVRPGGGELQLSSRPGSDLPRTKALIFLRGSLDPAGPLGPRGAVSCGELAPAPLEHLATVVAEVVMPLLTNEKNHQEWPNAVYKDIRRHTHNLQSVLIVFLGQVTGKTLLPLPVGSENMKFVDYESEKGLDPIDKSIVYTIESTVIKWSHQIQMVLKKESSEPLLQGENPTPKVEVEFWKRRCDDLEYIYNQLRAIKVRGMATLLNRLQSSYFPVFKAMFRDVLAALREAQDIYTHLKPLQHYVENIENMEFNEVKPLVGPLLHIICLIWATSKYYCHSAQIIVLLQEMNNLFIQQACIYLSPEDLLKGEIEESQRKIQVVKDIFNFFKEMFKDRRDNLKTYFKQEHEVREWNFNSSMVFVRMNGFLRRLKMIENLLKTAWDFLKLEKIEFSGIRGNTLSQQVQNMYEEFQNVYKIVSECSYDCLDPTHTEFENYVSEFNQKVEDLDRRLGTVFVQAFDDTPGLEHAFKLLEIFGSLLERPVVAMDAYDKYPILITMFNSDLDSIKTIYYQRVQEESELGFSQSHKNMPAVADGLCWAQELRERIEVSFNNLRHISHPCMEASEGKEMLQKYEDMFQLLEKYERKLYDNWCQTVSEKSQYNLTQPLLCHDPETKQITVNFNPQLISVLREVNYLKMRQTGYIPEAATDIFSSREYYRQLIANLELMTNWYNKILKTVLEVEFPLVEEKLQDIDLQLRTAEETLNWKTEGIWDYIIKITASVHDLEQRIQKTKDNVNEIQNIMKTWESPIFKRKDGKKESLLYLEEHQEQLEKYYSFIKESGLKIHALVQENLNLFLSDPTSTRWKTYIDYLDNMVRHGFFLAIESSLKYLLENTDSKVRHPPFFEAQLDLVIPELIFYPSLDPTAKDGFHTIVEGLINDIFRISSMVPRLAQKTFPHYQADMEDIGDLSYLRNVLMERVNNMMTICCDYRNSFDHYSFLYMDNRKEFMRHFLLYGHMLTAEELEAHGEDRIPENPPTLQQFKLQIDSYEKLYEEVNQLESFKIFDNWMKIDIRPFKMSLLNVIKKWSFMLKQHLIDHVTHSLADLEIFIRNGENGLNKKIEKGDFTGLVKIMRLLMALKERQSSTDEMFEPLKHTIELLKIYEQELPDAVFKQLEELPEKWNNIKKMAIMMKQHVAPLQEDEVTALRQKCAAFGVEQHTFREQFHKEAPFRYDSIKPYQVLDAKNIQIQQMESFMSSISDSTSLFEVNIPDYKHLKQCRKDICLLKELWDMIDLVNSSINDWKVTKWKNINVENMDSECKTFAKQIWKLDKEMRPWDAFTGLDNTVKNILTSLRAVAELQNPAIRERHWNQLIQTTGVKFIMNDDTTLNDLLKLELHNFEEEIQGIVDKAVKEMAMEKILNELKSTWIGMEFQYEPHSRTTVPLLKFDKDLIETLEDNQVQLQNLMTSKYIAFFLEEVSDWQKKLATSDTVISIWFEVQRTWSHLESIFIGSEDIRAQLPKDSKHFDGIDIDFKELVYDAQKTPNVIEATNKPGVHDQLENIQNRLCQCEKALTEYLDTKRLAFPRFYFLSSSDLLDVLSNGTNPQQVQRHLSKLFDSMARMKFLVDSSKKTTKKSLGMYSKEEEYVNFSEPCDCNGQAEIWLNHVLDHMRATIRHEMTEGVTAYEEKPREQWLFDYPAQVALTCTQIWWTTEVGIAFARLEEGYENAMKEYYKKQVTQLNTLITMLIGQLSKGDRQKIMTICTIDVHARDVVAKMISQKIENTQAFLWLSQLRHRWDDEKKHCFANICDAEFLYSYEYLGNTPRLVITPLTDRCYITLTQSLHLTMSGAPAGPAGTGKTETTKDLGRALGIMVYVFNCSEQMDYKSCGNIYKGLSQTGAWGCFDEFNRISVEVLSVVAVQLVDYRAEFSKWWITKFKTIKFPSQGTIFDFYIDPETKKFESWSKLIPKFEFDPDLPLQACLVHTVETIRVCYFMEKLLEHQRPIMLVGNAGTGKSVLVRAKLSSLDADEYMVTNVPFNYYTTSAMLQAVLEKPLDKKAGRNYGPPGTKKLIYFIDDMNMPEVDAYGTVQPHTLIRQYMDYGHWYDRNKLFLKEIINVQYVACMNPTAGSFTINPRLQRHFSTFVLPFPGVDALSTIYSTILTQHLKLGNFPASLLKSIPQLINLAITFHQKIAAIFLPTAIKFHYIFNLRDFSNIFQGILFSTVESIKSSQDLVKLYLHESNRVYRDKMVEEKDFDIFDKIQIEVVKNFFDDMDRTLEETRRLNMYCHFANGIGEPKYMPVKTWELLTQILVEALESHNEINQVMNLVLFEDAMCHVCRINRLLESPRGNALLIGVGGSGKQSLTRLAAFISSMDVFQITLRKGYSITDLKMDLANQCLKAGVKNISSVFLMTDAQVADERFLVLINDLLASGEIPDLYSDDEVENIISTLRNEVKSRGLFDSKENCWKFFIERVQRQLKVILCFSPVGNKLRVRSRKFPAIVNCTAIDWFHEWPQQALESVGLHFLKNMKNIDPTLKESISKFMAYVHTSVNLMSQSYLSNERRYNYTTPKSFLEQIRLYQNLMVKNGKELTSKMERIENGLQKLHSTSAQVDDLKTKLALQETELTQKNEDADKLIQVVGVETEKVSKEKAIADEEEQKVALIMLEVKQKQKDCEEDLAKAEPALAAAQAALNTLNKTNLTELKSFGSPPLAVSNVTAAVMVLMAPGGKVPRDRSWKAAKVAMARVDGFLDSLVNFNKEDIHENCLKAIRPYLQDPEFKPEFVASKSYAAAGLCSWVINIVRFYEVFCNVEPKRQALSKASLDLVTAQEKLAAIKVKIKHLNENLAKLTNKFEIATAEKLKCQQEAEMTSGTISLANRLVGGLASENERWAEAIKNFRQQKSTLCGDILLITAFISYLGYFTKRYRQNLMDSNWRPYLKQLKVPIPVNSTLDPLKMLTDDADIATWQNEGLPADRMSTENATIFMNCERWPLIVDPQLQGVKWIKKKYGEKLQVTQIGQKGYLDIIEYALANGDVVLIENMGESVDPVLGPLLGREVIKKGRFIKIGDKECEYNPRFRLILHTKLANPHYRPELQAQATLINFTVTRDGLEDQLLATVVSMERPDLEELRSDLTKQQNVFKITLKTLEDNLLSRLSFASGNFLGDTALVENLEITKQTAAEIQTKFQDAKITEVKINDAREHYRPVATRASLLYFIMNDLSKIHPMYQFSLKAFSTVFQKAVQKTDPNKNLQQRITSLIDNITFSVYQYTTRGLFECDKLTYITQLTFQILLMNQEISAVELDFLLRYPAQSGVLSPVDFLSHQSWGGIKALSTMEEFCNLDRDIEGSAKRWKKFVESECPEKEKFPQEWKNKSSLQQLCMMRAMRPDRMIYAMRDFVEEKLGSKYVAGRALDFSISFEESGPAIPMFFILSPGVDPLKDVEKEGKKLGYTFNNQNFHNVSLGQGQEIVAETALDLAAKNGHWVILQNIHLVAKWLDSLEKKLEQHSNSSHHKFRVFMSAEAATSPDGHIIPQGILENSIKITNEPPMGMHAKLHKALDNFTQDTLEMCSRETEFKSILFALCYFHAVVAERRKFGAQGWNRSYPFNTGDLTISVNILYNLLEANAKVPYDDLRYLFGEIMYGGHITDDWDRRLCRTYLEEFIKPEMLEGEMFLAPGFPLPGNMDYNSYHQYIDDMLPAESPYLYGLHPNAEIGFLTQTSEKLFRTVLEMQPGDSQDGNGGGVTREEKVKAFLDEILERITEEFNTAELMTKVEERNPYIVVTFQECERMNLLIREIQHSLKELDLGLKGELTMTSNMESLQSALYLDIVPESWAKKAYPSTAGLASWFVDLLNRIKELEKWMGDFTLPSAVWLAGFFNPQSFLTAIMQSMAHKNEWPLDKMALQCEVTKKSQEDFSSPPREGAYVHGLFMEGACWDIQAGIITEARLKDLTPPMPVIFIRAIPVDKQENRSTYPCPVYKTRQRGPTYVWTFDLKTKEASSKWILAGVALLLQV